MKQIVRALGLAIGLLVVLTACDSGAVVGGAKKDGRPSMGDGALMASADSAGRSENEEGVQHYQEKRWDLAEQHFRKAVETDPKLVEAHYNLGLTLDKMGDHDGATASFKMAAELSPRSSPMRESIILKEHIGQ
ncbi:MAG: tetratricopeptide repeat protein [Nitrospiraceae bacterium]